MNTQQIISKLKKTYPGKTIILNPPENPTEILCETDPPSLHAHYAVAVAVIDRSRPHYHKQLTEMYEILQGDLTLTVNDIDYHLKTGDRHVIHPHEIHWAKGDHTWVKVTSHPGWTAQDHILVDLQKILSGK